MNYLNIFIILGIAAASAIFVGVLATPVLAVRHDNMTMSMDNSTTGMTDNATMAVN